MTSRTWHITQCPLLASLKPDELNDIAALAHVFSFGSKRIISMDAQDRDYVWLVKRGHLKMNYTDAAGRQVAVVLLNPGDIFGALSTEPSRAFGEHCTALTPACLCRIAKRDFENLMMRHPALCMRVTRSSFERLQKLQIRLAEIMMRPAEARLAHALLELAGISGRHADEGLLIDLPVTHRDLSELIGTTREMVSCIMRKLRDLDLVESARQRVVILDEEGLRRVRDAEN
ncbi:Crp/Fnr family transcriptional regulator [Candidatus Poribacteria bacterium]|nr:Crp/Fnr family transcriptional regulator [Candidatus Poribacteria bacterium]